MVGLEISYEVILDDDVTRTSKILKGNQNINTTS